MFDRDRTRKEQPGKKIQVQLAHVATPSMDRVDYGLAIAIKMCALILSLIGLVVLSGWRFGFNDVLSFGKNFIPMADETALLFLLTGLAFLIVHLRLKRKILQYFYISLILFIGVSALLTLFDYFTDYQWNFSDYLGSKSALKNGIIVGKMSYTTAICFILLSLSFALIRTKTKNYTVILGSMVILAGYVILVGYTDRVPFFYNGKDIPMSWLTAIAFIISGLGLLFAAGKEKAPLRIFFGDSTRARLMRRILPVIFLLMSIHDFIEAYYQKDFNSFSSLINSVTDVVALLIVGIIISFITRSIGNSIDSYIAKIKKSEQELVKAKEHAEESDRLKSAFLANMSHEIRTPMNGILGFAGLLKEPNLSGEEQQEYIQIIEKSGERMLNIINNIVDISKIEAGQMELNYTDVNINEKIEFIFEFFKPQVKEKNMQFYCKKALSTQEAIIRTDGEKVYSILTNLVKNAVKYSVEGYIEIGYQKKEAILEFYVKDTGIGIPTNRQNDIFDRFIQVDSSDKKAFQGAGLGLSISKAYVEMLGGRMWVESKVGEGSTFYFTLPYNAESESTIELANFPALEKKEQWVRKIKILIAEDNEASEILLSIIVKPYSNDILYAKTGREAVECCRANPDLDLILMDIQMYDLNGYEATRQIRTFNKDVVIFAQTAFGLSGEKEKAIKEGCNEYLAKPINKVQLLSFLKTYFQQKPNPS